ncbi:hypothetical protein [Mesorhizobium sp. LjRoot246]|uniref:hypothetical protein n=1 Tax=Mesorhizobium sp. LjRoot246 TaxID=3342294 RepID=UPI003ECFE05D
MRSRPLVSIVHLAPGEPPPEERHVRVVVHRDAFGEKGYFFDSAEEDYGGSGPFDWRRDEALERAQDFAAMSGIGLLVIEGRLQR